jgi:hypothetical protein
LDRRCEQGPTSHNATALVKAGWEGAAFGMICKSEDLPGNKVQEGWCPLNSVYRARA